MPRLEHTQNLSSAASRRHALRLCLRRRRAGRPRRAGLPGRALSVALTVLLLSAQTPAAPLVLGEVASRWGWGLSVWLRTGGPEAMLHAVLPERNRAGRQEGQAERDARVVRVRVSPERASAAMGSQVFFSAAAFDADGAAVGGVSFRWEADDLGGGQGTLISPDGIFQAMAPGRYRVTAVGAGRSDQVELTVTEPGAGGKGRRPARGGALSTRESPRASAGKAAPGAGPRRRPTRVKGGATLVEAAFAYSRAGAPALLGGEDQYGWNNSNYTTADDPGGQVGNPPGSPGDGGAGSGNFQVTAPVVSLAGRGIDLGLSLVHNSHLWHKEGTNITYDIDRGWPAPGWSLGFGKMVDIGNGGTLIIEPDGTRHGFNGTIYPGGGVTFFNGHTTDGSFIDYDCSVGSAGIQTAFAKLRNGTVVYYGAPGAGAVYPTRITDPNGNYISVTYRDNIGPQIDTVTDTLGRIVTFKYDANNLLTSVTAPGFDGGDPRVLVRLHYQQATVNASFQGLTAKVRDGQPWRLDAIYYPATSTGYWFGDPDSYVASYGMLAKVAEQRGMGFSGDVTQPDMGSVTQGTLTKQAAYHWLTPASDAPTYDTLTETWDGMDTAAAVTTYDVRTNDSPRTSTVTLPGGARTVQYSYNAPGQYNDGLVFKDETYDADHTTVLIRSTADWQQGDYESPRPRYVTVATRARGGAEITTGTEFTYAVAPSYNQVTEVRDYDYGYVYGGGSNALLRRTTTQYENSTNYTSHHVFNLPKIVEVYGADGTTRVSRTEYQYDGSTLANTPGVVQHADAYNPYAPQQWVPTYCYPTGCGMNGCTGQTCVQGHYETSYKTETNYRGNVTQVTTYSDAAPEPASGAITETHSYDMDGNMLTSSTSCCEQTSYTFPAATQYAYPTSTARGAADPNSPIRITTGATYDFNTGLLRTSIDPDGRTSSSGYFAPSLRPQEDVSPTGARTTYDYDDAAMTVTRATLLAAGGPVVGKSRTYLNGMGQVKRVESLGGPEASAWDASVLDVVDTKYDALGRVWKESRPYRKGVESAENFTTTTYDVLGRVASVESPDGGTAQAFYNDLAPGHPRPAAASGAPGETTLFVDEWGREGWGRTDSQGRLVEVVEPDPDGGGGVTTGGLLTTYAYDTLGNLTDVAQDAQHRRFAYDSIGRLTRQKLAETAAVFDAGGQYVGPGDPNALWGDLFEYDSRSNLVARTDARNVRTNLWYQPTPQGTPDPLNRLFKVEYVVQTGPVAPADAVTYTYDTSGDLARVKSISTVDASAQARTTEEYRYDTQARVDQKTLTVADRPYHPLVTNYVFDNLDRIIDVIYPAQYPSAARKTVHHDYDPASRLNNLTVDSAVYASQFVYDASSRARELKVGAAGSSQVTEKYVYDPTTGLLAGQKAYRGADETRNRLLDLSYDYLRPGMTSGRTGQLTKVADNLNAEKGRAYDYDALGRLKRVSGGDPSSSALWTQEYSYDRWGNRKGVTAAGNTAALKPPAEPSAKAPDVELASNALPRVPEFMRGNTERGATTDAPTAPLLSGAAAGRLAAFLPGAPGGTTVTGSTAALVGLSWAPPAGGADHYEVERGQSLTGQFTLVGTTQGTTYADTTMPAGGAYLYRVRAVDGGGARSAPSNVALAAAFTFMDETIAAGVTPVKAQHVAELRQAVNAVRAAAGLGAASWTDGTLTPQVTVTSAAHIQELRDRLNEALTALQIATTPFTDPVLSTGTGGTAVRRVHLDELRQRVRRGQSASSGGGAPQPVPRDGFDALSYDQASNRISSPGWEYDAAGNQTRVKIGENLWQRYEYDAANRLVAVKTDASVTVASYSYCYSRQRLTAVEGSTRTYYAWGPAGVFAEYTEAVGATSPQWTKSYVYMGGRLLATQRPNGTGGELIEYNHPDRLGTRVVSNNADAGFYEQTALPYGTALGAESTGESNRRFTTYDRSNATGLDYAINRSYDPRQGRFTQADPLGAGASSVNDPQSWNLYAYCGNDPVNRTDPGGLFWGKLFRAIGKVLNFIYKVVMWATVALVTAVAIINPTTGWIIFAALMWLYALGGPTVRKILGIAGGIAAAYQQPPQIIFNFSSTVESARAVVLPWLSYLGPVNAFLFNSSGSGVQSEIDTAYDDTMKRLEDDKCRRLIQGNSSVDPRDALRAIKSKGHLLYSGFGYKDPQHPEIPADRGVLGHTDGLGRDATISIYRGALARGFSGHVPMLHPRPPTFTDREARSLLLLHELRHAENQSHDFSKFGNEVWSEELLSDCLNYHRNAL